MKKRSFKSSLKQRLFFFLLLSLLIFLPLFTFIIVTQKLNLRGKAAELTSINVQIIEKNYLDSHEPKNRIFNKVNTGDRTVFYYQRMIDNAVVEKDFINYQFDQKTGNFLNKSGNWRTDLPEHLKPLNINQKQAESMVKGKVKFSNLYLISPNSNIYKIKPTPQNPCWVVNSLNNDFNQLTVIDAVTGKILGNGIAPPAANGYAFTGPEFYDDPSISCSGGWDDWYNNARQWFEKMSYPTASTKWPSKEILSTYIKDPSVKFFYELAHGNSTRIWNSCDFNISFDTQPPTLGREVKPTHIKTWLANRDKMTFTFLGSCGGMCETNAGTFSYEFRKGSNKDSVTVGYCGMDEAKCSNCWNYSIPWQDSLFENIYNGLTIKSAFNIATANYPMCGESNNCMRFAGDEQYRMKQIIVPTEQTKCVPRPACLKNIPSCRIPPPKEPAQWCP